MRMAVYETGHQIADTVAGALARGFDAYLIDAKSPLPFSDVHMAYGILRGTGEIFKECKKTGQHWFNVDRGYFNPGHFDGYYRISHKGTQAKWHEGVPRKPGEFNLGPIGKRDGHVMICPPTEHVINFFGLKKRSGCLVETEWELDVTNQCLSLGYGVIVRKKESDTPINWDEIKAVITFNSSVGWEALRRGIPVLSNIHHSIIGSYYKETNLNKLIDNFYSMPDTRLELFEAMNAHQFKLDEIARGEAWPLIKHYLSGSAMTAEKLPAQM